MRLKLQDPIGTVKTSPSVGGGGDKPARLSIQSPKYAIRNHRRRSEVIANHGTMYDCRARDIFMEKGDRGEQLPNRELNAQEKI